MDPVTAVGLASAIITFVEFSWTLVRGAGDIYMSPTGSSRENASIGNVIADLEEVTHNISTDIEGQNKHERALIFLAGECESLSKELLQVLGKLKRRGTSKREALTVALRGIRKETEIASIEKRLAEYRVEIVVRLNLVLCNQQSDIKNQLDAIQQESRSLVSESSRAVESLRTTISETINNLRYEHNNVFRDPGQQEMNVSQLGHSLRESLQALEKKLLELRKETAVLRRLFFDAMFRREDDIPDPGYGTFEWVLDGLQPTSKWYTGDFEDDQKSQQPGYSFPAAPQVRGASPCGYSSDWSEPATRASLMNWDSLSNSESEQERNTRSNNNDGQEEQRVLSEPSIDTRPGNNQPAAEYGCSDFTSDPGPSNKNACGDSDSEVAYGNSMVSSMSYRTHEGDHGDQIKDGGEQAPGIAKDKGSNCTAHASTTLKLHGVYFRSNPAISKVQGNEPIAWHGCVGGGPPHLEHIMSMSERAKRRKISMGFASFLKHSNGVFFCCGKAGSGKSTFMKYIRGHSEVRGHLERWSGHKKLVMISIFFWNSGDELQTSMEGFYRSLLFQVVQQCPEILPEIFPDRVLQGTKNIRGQFFPFRFSELQDAIRRLLMSSDFRSIRFFFLIDGLDEYKGDSREHVELAQLLNTWATRDVKVICSARPHIEFLDTFTDSNQVIHLHEWTKDDIYRYAWSELHGALGSADVSREPLQSLVETITRKADGVFIWARLVIKSLLQGIAHRDSMKALHHRVAQAPKDLTLLYEKVLIGIDPAIRDRADRALFLVALSPFGPLNAMTFSWLDDLEEENFPLNRPFQIYAAEEIQDRTDIAKRQVALLTGGLVEMRLIPDAEIIIDDRNPSLTKRKAVDYFHGFFDYQLEYHHLTAHEFLTARAAAETDKGGLPEDLRDKYARLTLAEMKFSGATNFPLSRLQAIYGTHENEFHDIPDEYFDEIEACYSPGLPQCLGLLPASHPYRLLLQPLIEDQKEIGLPRRGLPFRPASSRYQLVHKGSSQNGIISVALSLHQSGYVVRKLQSDLANEITEDELATWLIAVWAIFPDPAVTKCVLSHRGLLKTPVETRSFALGNTLHISCWFGFLLCFVRIIQNHSIVLYRDVLRVNASQWWEGPGPSLGPWERAQRTKWIEMQCHSMEHLLSHGADKDVVFLLEEMTLERSSGTSPWAPEQDEWVADRGIIFYMDLLTMLDLIDPPPTNLKILQRLLAASPLEYLRKRSSSVMNKFRGQPRERSRRLPIPISEILKNQESDDGKARRFTLYAIQSETELLTGPISIHVY